MADTSLNLAAASLTFSVLSFLMLIVTLSFFLFPDFSATIKSGLSRLGGISEASGGTSAFTTFAAFLGALSPDITLLSGFVTDIINGRFRNSVTSLIGISAVILHWAVGGLIHGFNAGSAPSVAAETISSVAAAVAPASAVVDQLLGTGSENPTAPSPSTGAPNSGLFRRRGPASMSTMSTIEGASPPSRRGSRTAALNARLGPIIPGARPSRAVNLRGGGGEIPAEMISKFNPCSIRGLGMFDIAKSPMGMAALSSVFAVYILDMTIDKKRDTKDIGIYLGFSGIVYLLNLYSYSSFKCYGDTFGAAARATILPLIVGLVGGTAGFLTLKYGFPSYLPLDPTSVNTPSQPTCAPPNDKDQFVCDAWKDGKKISTAVVA
jgi:hypothetical protein